MTDLGICQGVGGQVGESYEYVLLSSSVSLKPIDFQQCSKTRSVSILNILLHILLSPMEVYMFWRSGKKIYESKFPRLTQQWKSSAYHLALN